MMDQRIVRGLHDKVYEKRKAAALEVEKLVREHQSDGDDNKVSSIIHVLCDDFAYSSHPNARMGGLIGLAAAAIALGPEVAQYLESIVPPILACFNDQDSRVRYYACESMYNVSKVAKGEVLIYFNECFDALSKLAADSELSVKNGAELLDRLIKDIVAEQASTYITSNPAHWAPWQARQLEERSSKKGEGSKEVREDQPRTQAFSLERFIPLLAERTFAINPYTRTFLISWIRVLDSVPDLELVSYLPDFLDGLLRYLADVNTDVRIAAQGALSDLILEVREVANVKARRERAVRFQAIKQEAAQKSNVQTSPPHDTDTQAQSELTKKSQIAGHRSPTLEPDSSDEEEKEEHHLAPNEWEQGEGLHIDHARIVEILLHHLDSPRANSRLTRPSQQHSTNDEEIQATALRWISELIPVAPEVIVNFMPQIVGKVLPGFSSSNSSIREIALKTESGLYSLVKTLANPSSEDVASSEDFNPNRSASPPELRRRISENVKTRRDDRANGNGDPSDQQTDESLEALAAEALNAELRETSGLDYGGLVNTLIDQFLNEAESTRVAALEWLIMLQKKSSGKILAMDDRSFPALLRTLSDSSDDVVKRDLQLLAQISKSFSKFQLFQFLSNLLKMFHDDRKLLETRGGLIVRQLCTSLNTELIYKTFAEIVEQEEDLPFASILVQNLNLILLVSPELSDFRRRLKNLDTKENQALFTSIYTSWSHNAVSTFTLCLLTQAYEHAANLMQIFAELEITVNILIQIDKLVQLLESPVFTYLRLQLLEPEKNPYLFKCLYGLLMLLPQSSAFATLRNRLNSVSALSYANLFPTKGPLKPGKAGVGTGDIRWNDLLSHFRNVQNRHERVRRQRALIERDGGSVGGAPGSVMFHGEEMIKTNSLGQGSGSSSTTLQKNQSGNTVNGSIVQGGSSARPSRRYPAHDPTSKRSPR